MYNFNSGPSILPKEVLQDAAEAIYNFNNIGLSILEIGHRTEWFLETMAEAQALVKELMGLDDDFDVLFLHGGATTQFMQVPMNFLQKTIGAAYCVNGIWGKKAIREAMLFGPATEASSSADKNDTYIPKQIHIAGKTSYLHFTSNNTVEGTQWQAWPETDAPLVADMSSDILSRTMDFKKCSLIYAGAQKNIGMAGTTLVVIRKDFLQHKNEDIPAIMDYQNHINAGSILNTPPVFAIYVSLLTLRWIKKEGGLGEMEKRNRAKATYFYDALDRLPLYTPLVEKEDRSMMNAVFTIEDKKIEKMFLEACKENGMVGIKGHRSKGGLRVSMYNALPMDHLEDLVKFMEQFSLKYAQ